MLNKTLIFNLLCLLTINLNGQFDPDLESFSQILIEENPEQTLYFNHKVTKKESLYRISRIYNISTNTLYSFNQFKPDDLLKENSLLKIPFDPTQLTVDKKANSLALFYKVQTKENLYGLSKRKLKIDKKILKKLNPQIETSFQEGMQILVGYLPLETMHENESEPADINAIIAKPSEQVFTKESRGVAISESVVLGDGRLFALHNEARIESMIEIINPIQNRKVLAKVIGRIPPIYEKDVKVLVSAEVSRQLAVIGKRFFVNIRYR
ncbi:MAG: LysM peptidoglycan-binding domain-containing protein [Saprospiraceae bacterium]|nr:LysM peptidoglycan-binding domain-containing protein [Saprospiraceae bacterium]MBK7736831.1 LysM peptidoglycan-binding domain-containing protein [Saprospiraceae bacterium]MBK7914574.1 LysM peptidoglycan-binding domain-containing protein [Saprospiraceae bacterium]